MNQNYFDSIDCEHKAYFLGVLFGHGCNNVPAGFISIGLLDRDRSILDALAGALGCAEKLRTVEGEFRPASIYDKIRPASIYDKMHRVASAEVYVQPRVRLCVSSRYLSSRLETLGLVHRKTKLQQFPVAVPDHLLHHFVRGFFDTRGMVGVYDREWNDALPRATVSFNSTLAFLTTLRQVLHRAMDVGGSLSRQRRCEGTWRLTYNGNGTSQAIANYVYADATIFLQRHRDTFERIPTSSRRDRRFARELAPALT